MNLEKLKEVLKVNKQPIFRLRQTIKAVYQDGVSSFGEISTLPQNLREILEKEIAILPFSIEKIFVSRDERSIKTLLKLIDGNFVETVLISPKPEVWSACISSQVGCPMGCLFCATGKSGFKRNLTAEEITGQILFWKQYLKNSLKLNPPAGGQNLKFTIVFMGMGEPFLNWENVREGLKILTDKDMFGFSSRSISISTCGIPEGIKKLAKEFPQVNLAISLHFASDKKRSEFMPINEKYDLDEIKKALEKYFAVTRRKVFIEYIMLAGENDSLRDAEKLAEYLKSIGDTHLLHVNLIRYNITSGRFSPSPENKIQDFKNYLLKKHLSVTIRKSLGEDIEGACGQLAGK
jgi:23S rRNA (adenine(2503)-C(2))-methyltransferase